MDLFQVKFSKDVIVITVLVLLIEGVLLGFMISQGVHMVKIGARMGLVIVSGVALLIFAINVLVLFWVPKDYRVTKDKVVVMGIFRPIKEINRQEIRKVEVVDNALRDAIRTFASGGLYGYFGKFSSDRFGYFDMYAGSSGKRAVLIESLSNQKLILVPPDAEAFVALFKNEAPSRAN